MGSGLNYLFDTTVLIDHVVGRPSAVAIVKRLFSEGHELLTCDAIVAEALSGGTDRQREEIETLLQALEYVSTHPDAARHAGAVRRNRGVSRARSLGDALIAGVAWFTGATIVTRNPADFVAHGIPVLTYG